MSLKKAYINGSSCISPQLTHDKQHISLDKVFDQIHLQCEEPDYKQLPAGTIGRRMNKLTKIGVTAAYRALEEADSQSPDAILTGTGLGFMTETEKFLLSILDNDEQLVNPTAFMQSTHNTLGGQIALMLKCKNYNFTYVHKGFAFESALLDGMMKITEGDSTVLVGGFDEMTERHFKITRRIDQWRYNDIKSTDLYKTVDTGTLAGEGAAFFVLADKPAKDCCCSVDDLHMFLSPKSSAEVAKNIQAFLVKNKLKPDDIDVLLSGRNGDKNTEKDYNQAESLFTISTRAYYKHLSGEFCTSGSFALWLAEQMIRQGEVFPECMPNPVTPGKPVNTVLIYNQYRETDHSLYLIRNCRSTG